MNNKWIDLTVKAPIGSRYSTPRAMKEVDDALTARMPAMFLAPPPSGMPVQAPDGTYEVRVLMPEMVGIVKRMLTEMYGLQIVKEVEHSDNEPLDDNDE